MRLGAVGITGEGAVELLDRRIVLLEILEGDAHIAMGLGIIGPALDCLAVGGDLLRVALLLRERLGAVEWLAGHGQKKSAGGDRRRLLDVMCFERRVWLSGRGRERRPVPGWRSTTPECRAAAWSAEPGGWRSRPRGQRRPAGSRRRSESRSAA